MTSIAYGTIFIPICPVAAHKLILEFYFHYSVTINKTSDLDNNTDTLKKLTAADKPNNQTKLASVSGTPLPPSQIKCNILKGNCMFTAHCLAANSSPSSPSANRTVPASFAARAEEEAAVTPTKLTNQLFVKSANSVSGASNSNAFLDGDNSIGAATFVSVVNVRCPSALRFYRKPVPAQAFFPPKHTVYRVIKRHHRAVFVCRPFRSHIIHVC